ncbi:homocysteine S-methyltransferase family protein [Paludisphaera borealis]|uniref:Bifunctional homocysteine S-methyltransferase/5,10-methylenetetrahydrofolate reductase n=1 Tax=Paludisphaera borealis TaxID=1387353 RepID=A0A1U7CJW6_9BACT|nr:homocysteine S-methyltransferase family protein [Paludisphaera borealis]APW59198.1 Bifunctional homocysteine S-methyltransferase/5,10-methylenetetrahydrofolate reductase [Paludisphaera borealis]
MNRLQHLFPAGRVVVADGGWGSELLRRGLVLGESADLWNQSHLDVVEAVARSYVEAGADVVLTNTFQANPIALGRLGKATEAVNRRGAEISRRAAASAADRVVRVFGSIGPIGAGRLATDAFALQAGALAEGGVDALLFETFSDLDEARLAVAAARPTGLPIIVSFHFDDRTGEPLTLAGATPEEVANAMCDAGADAVGANCGAGPERFPDLCRRLKAASGLPVWIKPNAGLPTTEQGRAVYPLGPEAFAAFLPALTAAGADFVGGCCGAGPDFVRALVAARDQTPYNAPYL